MESGEIVYFVASVAVIYDVNAGTQRHYTEHTDDIKWWVALNKIVSFIKKLWETTTAGSDSCWILNNFLFNFFHQTNKLLYYNI